MTADADPVRMGLAARRALNLEGVVEGFFGSVGGQQARHAAFMVSDAGGVAADRAEIYPSSSAVKVRANMVLQPAWVSERRRGSGEAQGGAGTRACPAAVEQGSCAERSAHAEMHREHVRPRSPPPRPPPRSPPRLCTPRRRAIDLSAPGAPSPRDHQARRSIPAVAEASPQTMSRR